MTDTQSVRIERNFAAPIDQVWTMWADAQHFASWYGPTGATIPKAEMDTQVGGTRFVTMEMQTPDGTMQMHFTGEFVEVEEPNRLVYTEAMCDADGNITPPEQMGMPPGTPATRVIVELTAIDGGTAMVMTHEGVPADSPGAMGWGMAIDKLDALLA